MDYVHLGADVRLLVCCIYYWVKRVKKGRCLKTGQMVALKIMEKVRYLVGKKATSPSPPAIIICMAIN